MVVVAAADPEPRARLVDRYLVAAYDAGIAPLLVITKTDLADPEPFLANFAGLDVPVVRSARGAWPIAELAPMLDGHTTVAVGHSGV
ncbi:GTPase RsgA, partial [Mesorhizobium japonicum]|uniref:GTPase RsgA n=1 Tax=Mesorhizobium japonicum TaxID=2066070 RepID=UPI003B5B9E98